MPKAAFRHPSILGIAAGESSPIFGPTMAAGTTAMFKHETSEFYVRPDCLPSGVETSMK